LGDVVCVSDALASGPASAISTKHCDYCQVVEFKSSNQYNSDNPA